MLTIKASDNLELYASNVVDQGYAARNTASALQLEVYPLFVT